MSKYDKLDETFDVTPTEVEVTEKKIEKIKSGTEDIKRDYEYTRGNLYSIIEKKEGELIDGILELYKRVRCYLRMKLYGGVD